MRRYHLCFWKSEEETNKDRCPKCGRPVLDPELIGGTYTCVCELMIDYNSIGIYLPVNFIFTGDRSWNGEMESWSTPEDNGWKPHEKFTGSMLLKNAGDEQNILKDESTGKIIAIRNAFTLTGNYESSDSDIDGSFPVTGEATDELKFTNNGFRLTRYWSIISSVERQEVTTDQDIIDYANGNACNMLVTVKASNDWWDSILFNGDENWVDYEKFVSLTAASSHNQMFVEQDGYIKDDKVAWWDVGGENTAAWPFVGPTFVNGEPGPLQMTTIKTVQFRLDI